MILLLAACAAHQPPILFPTPLPDVALPETPEITISDNECDEAAPYKPGAPPPFVVDGVVMCRAQVVPESQVLELLGARALGDYWGEVGPACYERSEADRTHAQVHYAAEWDRRSLAESDARILRLSVPVAFVGGVLTGLGAGAAYAAATGVLP